MYDYDLGWLRARGRHKVKTKAMEIKAVGLYLRAGRAWEGKLWWNDGSVIRYFILGDGRNSL